MAATNINRVVITGNLTRDPELRSLPSGMSVCSLRIASNTRRKDGPSGEWVDKPNYFSVTVWGAQGENCAALPVQGPPGLPSTAASSGASGRARTAPSASRSRSSPTPCSSSAAATTAGMGGGADNGFAPHSDVPADTSDFAPQPVGARNSAPADDDIPF